MKGISLVILLAGIFAFETKGKAQFGNSTSLQIMAMAPNAGGQEAYALRRANNEREWSLFMNQYLLAGGYPLSGISYAKRFPICELHCPIQAYVQAGGGLSTAGPLIELLWGTNIFWLARIDIATQIYFSTKRVIFWSYPLWVGFSVPF